MTTQKSHRIEENQRFSKSMIWTLQRKFFSQKGEKAWSKNIVPHYITSNPYIAQAYAGVMFGWLRDVADQLDQSQPVYIVELGAGSGRLAYHFLKNFFAILDSSVLRDSQVTYIMTDFTQTTLNFWTEHPQLKAWIEAGRLDFAKFDAESDTSFALINQGIVLGADTLKNPLGLVANYFFDGLTQDVFRIKQKTLHESLVTLTVPDSAPNLNDPDLLRCIDFHYTHHPIDTATYYEESAFNSLLQDYESSLSQTTLVFPIGSLACLGRLRQLSNDNLFLLAGDKGYHHESDLFYRGEPGLSVHGSFSMMVNYHAIGQYTESQGGQFLCTPHHPASLDICGLLFSQHPEDYPETQHAYQQAIVRNNPDDFYAINKSVDTHDGEFDVKQFLAYLRFSGWDSGVLFEYVAQLRPILEDVSIGMSDDLYEAVMNVWEMYFHLGEERDLPLMLGKLLYGLDYHEEAIDMFQHSLKLYGDQATTLCNLAQCHYDLFQLETAFAWVNQSLAIDPKFEPAHDLKAKIERDL